MQPTTSADALSSLESTESQAQDPNSILANQNQQLGVNNAQQTVTGLRGAINNTTKLLQQVAPSVMGRTANSLVTNAQAGKQIQNEQAPIQQNLTQEGTDYNQSNEDLQQLQQQAQTAASGIYQGQQDKLSYAQNLYNSLYQQEQDAASQAYQQQQLAEQAREADQSAKASGSSSSGLSSVLGALLGGGSAAAPKVSQRSGGGYNFTDANGNAISAGTYATQSGTPIGTLLKQMGQSGDTYAQQAYNEIQANQSYYNAHPDVLKSEFSSLFWGA